MSEVTFNEYDKNGHYINPLPPEPLISILHERVNLIRDAHNALSRNTDQMHQNLITVDSTQKMALDNLSAHSNTHTHEIDQLKETDKLVLDMLEIFELRAIDAISAEETLRILRMRQSPDQENHVMAAGIIRNKRIQYGLSVADQPEEKPEL